MKFANPWFLLLIIFPLGYIFLKYFSPFKVDFPSGLIFSSLEIIKKEKRIFFKYYEGFMDFLLSFSLLLFIISLARPLGGKAIQSHDILGIDIVMCLDVSGSMLNYDGIPANLPYRDILGERIYYDPNMTLCSQNRLNSAKKVIADYIDKQEFNRIALVVFAGYSYTKCPLTLDKEMLKKILGEVKFDPANDGTAIGMGIATGINRIKNSKAKSRIIVLLTDGNNNTGLIDPLTAATIATNYGIRIYTIGLGNEQGFLQPVDMSLKKYVVRPGMGLDEETLMKIANITGGKFFRAYEPDALKSIYEEIDRLEKSKIEIKRKVMYKENFFPFLFTGSILLFLYILFNFIICRFPD